MQAVGIDRAHVSVLSLDAATGMWLAGKYTQKSKIAISNTALEPRPTPS